MDVRTTVQTWIATPDQAWFGLLIGAGLVCLEFIRPAYGFCGLVGGVALVVCAVQLGPVPGGLLALATAALLLTRRTRLWLVPSLAAAVCAAQAADVSIAGTLGACAVALLICALLQIAERARRNKLAR